MFASSGLNSNANVKVDSKGGCEGGYVALSFRAHGLAEHEVHCFHFISKSGLSQN